MILADALAEAMLDIVVTQTVVISLHTADPGDTGDNEITGSHRITLTASTDWSSYATSSGARVTTNANDEEFTNSASADEEVTHFTMWEDDGTTFLLSNAVTNPQQLTTGNPVSFPAGSFTFGMITDDSA